MSAAAKYYCDGPMIYLCDLKQSGHAADVSTEKAVKQACCSANRLNWEEKIRHFPEKYPEIKAEYEKKHVG